jgi:hypothetical protein
MKISWSSILAAVTAVLCCKIVAHFFGFAASVVFVGVLLLCWLGAYLFYRRQLVSIRSSLAGMSEEQRFDVLSHATPEIRRDLARMEAKERGPIQSLPHSAGSRPSSNNLPESETPSSLGPRS